MTDRHSFIGLMSGTSLDGVDAVCCRFGPFELLGHAFLPMPADLRETLLTLQAPSTNELHLAMCAANGLADWYAEAVTTLLTTHKIDQQAVRAIGCHGQTIRHQPAHGYTIQLNQPARLAELTHIDVIADFRSRDIAAGGQGAPLVPAFHQAMFGKAGANRVILNVGGMANLTHLHGNENVIGFDCGPGNVLLDAWINACRGEAFDEDGAWAAQGKVAPELLARLQEHAFLAASPPKSCGREDFNLDWLRAQLRGDDKATDVQATLVELTALSASEAIRQYCGGCEEVLVCGGGARNRFLLQRLAELLPAVEIATTEREGLAVDVVESAAFAWLAHAFVTRSAGNIPAVTGALGPRILGALYPA